MNPCPTPPVCELGKLSYAVTVPFRSCVLRYSRYDSLGQRPEVDRVNVVPCDGTLTGDAILFGPLWIAESGIREAGGDPEKIGREGAEFVRRLRENMP